MKHINKTVFKFNKNFSSVLRVSRIMAVIGFSLFVTSCSSLSPKSSYAKLIGNAAFSSALLGSVAGAVAIGYEKKYPVEIKVYYATDRKPKYLDLDSHNVTFHDYTSDRAVKGNISYGSCLVHMPTNHKVGEFERPASFLGFKLSENPSKHIMLLASTPSSKSSFFDEINNSIRESKGKNAFVFVHGYNVSFEDAALRTAQLHNDLKFDGVPMFFSWPSKAKYLKYPADEQTIEWAQPHLMQFLSDILTQSNADNIYLIAHSMGNRALTRAFIGLINERPVSIKRIKAVILTAPDIDREVFLEQLAPQLVAANTNVTLYASNTDEALRISQEFHEAPRVGLAGDNLVIVPGVDTIDATYANTDFLGHSYFSNSRSVLEDIFTIIHDHKKPDQRFYLKPANSSLGKYWLFTP
ncbi:MAG: alpha/beta hydrolase [Methylobacter sp.]|nr:alpha/beta hydrolase [Methylobacter sp.]